MTTVVLGWDALDYELADEFGLLTSFGDYHTKIETYNNPYLGKPHTKEIWPSIITGLPREEHGLWVQETTDRKEWGNTVIELLSKASTNVVPRWLRTGIGELLLSVGAEGKPVQGPAYFNRQGITTVFDERRARPISIPNYLTSLDDNYDFDLDRSEAFDRIVKSDSARFEPNKPIDRVEEVVTRMAMARLGVVSACMEYDYDIIFVWLGYLDTVGHLVPVLDEAGWQRRAYRAAAAMTDAIRSKLVDGDVLVCVSDHGLRDGRHTQTAYFGASEDVTSDVDSVLHVREALETVTPRSDPDRSLRVREPFRFERQGGESSSEELQDRLRDLGYL